MSSDLMVTDLETNGRDIPDIRITQIGAVMLERNTLKEIGRFSTYVGKTQDDPPLSGKSIEITGITDGTIKGYPTFHVAGRTLSKWAHDLSKDFIPTAWGTHFDIPTLRWEYARCGMAFGLPGKSFCIKSAVYAFFWTRGVPIYRCGVSTCLRILGLKFEGKPHDGLDDALNEARILRTITGVDKPSPTAQVKYGTFVKTEGSMPLMDLDKEDRKSPYD